MSATTEQPEITIVNLDASSTPSVWRCGHADISAPSTLVKVAQFLESENATIVNVSLSPSHLCVVAGLPKGDWMPRFQEMVQIEWPEWKIAGGTKPTN